MYWCGIQQCLDVVCLQPLARFQRPIHLPVNVEGLLTESPYSAQAVDDIVARRRGSSIDRSICLMLGGAVY